MTAGLTIDYEVLTQEALRGVVRAVLSRAAKTGLPGDHHFYISFHTQAPGVTISKRLREKYPREMTIVLQHRFWDLTVTDERFDVKLTFDGIPERIIVPFGAIKVFFDPSVRYGMQFDGQDGDLDASTHLGPPLNYDQDPGLLSGEAEEQGLPPPPAMPSAAPRRPRVMKKPRADKGNGAPVSPLPTVAGGPDAARVEAPDGEDRAARDERAGSRSPAAVTPSSQGAEIVRLDAFRKK